MSAPLPHYPLSGAHPPPGAHAPLRFAGYAAIFGRRDLGGDVLHRGAFARSLAARARAGAGPLPLYWQHRPDQPIGAVERVAEDARGLRVIARLDPAAAAAALALRRGAARGLSFGYRATAAQRTAQGRELLAVELFEVSLVTRPMQPWAQVHLLG